MSYINQIIILQGPLCFIIAPFQKKHFLPLQFGQEKNISGQIYSSWKLNWKESLLIYFENCQDAHCSHKQSRNRMMNTFIIIVNITSLEDKSMLLVHFKKAFPLTLLGYSFERRAYWWLVFHFESYQGKDPYLYTSKVDRGWWTLC